MQGAGPQRLSVLGVSGVWDPQRKRRIPQAPALPPAVTAGVRDSVASEPAAVLALLRPGPTPAPSEHQVLQDLEPGLLHVADDFALRLTPPRFLQNKPPLSSPSSLLTRGAQVCFASKNSNC